MAFVYILEINDAIFGASIELAKRLIDLSSRSKPHITVRYAEKLKNRLDLYDDLEASDIRFTGVGSFGFEDLYGPYVVYIKCSSDDLETLAYKPHFPDSVFHITLYSGDDREVAQKVLDLLNKYMWKFTLKFLSANKLVRKTVGVKAKDQRLSDSAQKLWKKIYGRKYCQERIDKMSFELRESLVENIFSYVFSEIYSYENILLDLDAEQGSSVGNLDLGRRAFFEWEGKFKKKKYYEGASFLTPPELALDIANYVKDHKFLNSRKINFGEPAIGTGTLFAAVLAVFSKENIESAIGVELNGHRAKSTHEKWKHKGLNVINNDFFKVSGLKKRNFIVANPPYVRYQNIDPVYRRELQGLVENELNLEVSGFSNLYVYFILLSHKWMEVGAISCWLVPTEFISSVTGRPLRDYLTSNVTLLKIHIFTHSGSQFENAQVSSCVVIFENRRPDVGQCFSYSLGDYLDSSDIEKKILISAAKVLDNWNILIDDKEKELDQYFMSDIFTVKRGIATGANSFFIITREKMMELELTLEYVRPILPGVKKIMNENVICPDLFLKLEDDFLYVIDTAKSMTNIKIDSPKLYEYIKNGEDEFSNRTLLSKRNPWYKQEYRDVPMFVCSNMGRGNGASKSIKFFLNKTKCIATNSYILLYPNLCLKKALDSGLVKENDLLNYLNAVVADTAEKYSKSYGDGLRKIEPSTLKGLPLYNLLPEIKEIIKH